MTAPLLVTPSHSLHDRLSAALTTAARGLMAQQHADGHLRFELEADATMPADYIALRHYFDRIRPHEQAGMARYLRRTQGADGGWPLFHEGEMNLSASVRAYFALKLAGDDPRSPHMVRAREAILASGGAERSNVFTRISLALFGQVPWHAVPCMPVELMLMPDAFPVSLGRMAYWSRVTLAPLMILMAKRPQARNPRGVQVRELFVTPPEEVRDWNRLPQERSWGQLFLAADRLLRAIEPYQPARLRERAIQAAVDYFVPRMNGEDGLGGILPPMCYALQALDVLGWSADHPVVTTGWRAVEKLVAWRGDEAYCQSCLSPVWDTALAAHALMEVEDTGLVDTRAAVGKAVQWTRGKQILEERGDWARNAPGVEPGGWAFMYSNPYFPDTDDTAVAALALERADAQAHSHAVARAAAWLHGMQSRGGGWGAYDKDNEAHYLNAIPFADHGALLDPPTADVTARCVSLLACQGRAHPAIARGLDFLRRTQEEDGSWYGRWGTNYVYGTWSVLCALNACGEDLRASYVRRAVDFLLSRQREDGGWGEDCATYWEHRRAECKTSTPSQTAWALLGLMAAGEVEHPAVEHGIEYLLNAPHGKDGWQEAYYNAVGFPRVFFLRYHGYPHYFPLWALARYHNLRRRGVSRVEHGL